MGPARDFSGLTHLFHKRLPTLQKLITLGTNWHSCCQPQERRQGLNQSGNLNCSRAWVIGLGGPFSLWPFFKFMAQHAVQTSHLWLYKAGQMMFISSFVSVFTLIISVIEPCYRVTASSKLTLWPRLPQNLWQSSCFYFWSAGITDMCC